MWIVIEATMIIKDNDGFISLQEYQDTSYGVIEG